MPNAPVPAAARGLPPTRRRFLAAGSAGAALAVAPAMTPATASHADISPELEALIAAHREADDSVEKANAAVERAENHVKAFAASIDWSTLRVPEWSYSPRWPPDYNREKFEKALRLMNSYYLCGLRLAEPEQLRRAEGLWKDVAGGRMEAFDRLAARVEEAREAHRVDAAWSAYEGEIETLGAAHDALLACRCRTLAEVRVWAAYLRRNIDRLQEDSAVDALAALAGIEERLT